jgi:signal transduction histidine kinase
MYRVIEAQEAERYRIARDIHDHLGQRLTGLRFKLETLAEAVGKDLVLREKADEIGEMAARLDRDLAYLSWELRPTELEHLGLVDALQSFVREWTNQFGIKAEFHGPASGGLSHDRRLSQNAETNLYRIVQEALNNILKHSEATKVDVVLHWGPKDLILAIEDNGKGFDPEAASSLERKFGGQGLIGMRERSAWIGGSLIIESGPGKGTTLLVRVPDECSESASAI